MKISEILQNELPVLLEVVVKLAKPEENSKGELCYYAVKSHRTKKVLSRHKTREQAEKRLVQIRKFSHF